MARIRLHSKRGLDPRLLCCPRCGVEVGVTVGAQPDNVPENARIADSQPCKACRAQMALAADEVRAGGVAFICDECKSEGAIRRGAAFAARVRSTHDTMQVQAGLPRKYAEPKPDGTWEPCGVRFDKCEQHKAGE